MQTLGSQFLAHPAIAPYRVTVTDPSHPLVKGIEPFETSDELYVSEFHGAGDDLARDALGREDAGLRAGRVARGEPRPVMYLHEVGKGPVLYLTLGHCRGHFDMRPVLDWWPTVDRGSWELPVYHELLRRGLAWAKREAV